MTLTEYFESFANDQKRVPSLKPVVAALSEILARLLLMQNAYKNFLIKKTQVVDFPYSEVEVTVEQIVALIALATTNLDAPWDFVVTLRGELRALRNLRLTKDIFTSRGRIGETVDNVFLFQSRSRKGYKVQWGDTLRGVAQRFLHDGDRWFEIASLNQLDYPYVVNTLEELVVGKNLVRPGDTITLPLDAAEPNNQVVGGAPTDYNTLLGQDIQLTPSGYVIFDEGGDLLLIAGADNLAQAIRHRLIVPKGQLPLHPDYGSELELYIGAQGDDVTAQQVALESRRTVMQDPRVTRVSNLTALFSATTAKADMTVWVIGQESPMELNLVIPRPA